MAMASAEGTKTLATGALGSLRVLGFEGFRGSGFGFEGFRD